MPGRKRSPGRRGLTAVTDERSVTPPRGDTTEEAAAVTIGEKLLSLAATGVPVDRAAEQMGVPKTTAFRYFKEAAQRAAGLDAEAKREWVAIHMETLRMVSAAHMPLALGRPARPARNGQPALKAEKPSIGSAQVVLAALKQRAELIGIEAALQVEISTYAIDDAVTDIIEIVDSLAPVVLPELPSTRGLLPEPAEEDPAG